MFFSYWPLSTSRWHFSWALVSQAKPQMKRRSTLKTVENWMLFDLHRCWKLMMARLDVVNVGSGNQRQEKEKIRSNSYSTSWKRRLATTTCWLKVQCWTTRNCWRHHKNRCSWFKAVALIVRPVHSPVHRFESMRDSRGRVNLLRAVRSERTLSPSTKRFTLVRPVPSAPPPVRNYKYNEFKH